MCWFMQTCNWSKSAALWKQIAKKKKGGGGGRRKNTHPIYIADAA